MKNKKYLTVTEILAENGSLSIKNIADKAGISRSSAVRITEILLSMGILSEHNGRRARRLYLSSPSYFFIFDITRPDAQFYAIAQDYSVKYSVSRRYRADILPSDNLSLFFRDCCISSAKRFIEPASVSIIMSDENFNTTSSVYGSCDMIERICNSYFSSVPHYIGPRGYHIANYLKEAERKLPESNSGRLIISSSGSHVYAIHSHSSYALLRNVKSDALLHRRTPAQAGAEIAAAVGNTIALMNIRRVLFDSCEMFADGTFRDAFTDALSVYLGNDMPDNFEVCVSSYPLAYCGAVYHARFEHYKNLIETAETEVSDEFLST